MIVIQLGYRSTTLNSPLHMMTALTPDTIRLLAAEIANQTILNNWLFYIVLACLSVILSAAGSFLAAYFSKRAERLALTADFDEIKRQLKETTTLAETVKVDIQRLAERSEKLQWQKREKLESYIVAIAAAIDYQTAEMSHSFFDADPPSGGDPIYSASMYMSLYLPELKTDHQSLMKAISEFQLWMSKGMTERVEQYKQHSIAGSPMPTPTEAHMSAYSELLAAMKQAQLRINETAEKLAQTLNHN
ncbi:MAG: hypothetical protein JSR69_09255 [Proteobacteria bacterium]|nr:hypothetical protein [Pseudomonadota bacterium]